MHNPSLEKNHFLTGGKDQQTEAMMFYGYKSTFRPKDHAEFIQLLNTISSKYKKPKV
jgi:hypothetical protein